MSAKSMEVELEDGRAMRLASSDWIGEGGEGAVYKKGNLAIKIVEDKAALAKKEPKLRIFKKIKHPSLATPLSLAFEKGALVGYAMEMIDGVPLARLMSPAWRAQNGYGADQIDAVCKSMVEALGALHAHGVWGGDINEFNWKVKSGRAILIDCDSWGCMGHSVSAMLPSIADPKAKGHYLKESDWYALAILIFQLHCGIHPFRGGLTGYGPKDLARRMEDGASMLDPNATWPASVPGPDALPATLKDWMVKVFSSSDRSPPPSGDWRAVKKARKAVRSSGAALWDSPFESWAGAGLARLEDGSFFDLRSKSKLIAPASKAFKWVDPTDGAPWWIWQSGQKLLGSAWVGQEKLECQLAAGAQLVQWGDEFFAIKDGAWFAMALRRMGSSGVKAMAVGQGALGSSVEMFDGCLMCASMGAHTLLRPVGKAKGAMALPIKAPERSAKLAMASATGAFEFMDWALSSGARIVAISSQGKTLGSIDGELEWACAAGEAGAIVQISGQAWLIGAGGAHSRIDGWIQTESPAQVDQGTLWRVDDHEAKAYPLAKILASKA